MKMITLAIAILISQQIGQEIPNIEGRCEYGRIVQTGARVSIVDDDSWTAVGCFQADGTLQLIWTYSGDGSKAFGVYRLNGKALIGKYGFLDQINVKPDGTVDGPTAPETLRLGDDFDSDEPPQF